MTIDFISAARGGIELFPIPGRLQLQDERAVGWADNGNDLARIMARFGLADRVLHSSTMDFASEEGFEDDGTAWVIWATALEEYRRIMVLIEHGHIDIEEL